MNTHEIVLAIRDRRGYLKSRKRDMRRKPALLMDYYSLDAQKMRKEKSTVTKKQKLEERRRKRDVAKRNRVAIPI